MGTRTLTVVLPDQLVDRIEARSGVDAIVLEALVLDLLRDATISQGQAAELLSLDRGDLLLLMARHSIPSGPETIEEYDQDLRTGRDYLRNRDPRADDQRQSPPGALRSSRMPRSSLCALWPNSDP